MDTRDQQGMSIYHRYASREHDDAFFNKQRKKKPLSLSTAQVHKIASTTSLKTTLSKKESKRTFKSNHSNNNKHNNTSPYNTTSDTGSPIQIGPLLLDESPEWDMTKWNSIVKGSAYFVGYDFKCFGQVLIMVYQNPRLHGICTRLITKFGVNTYEDLIVDSSSRFWPACENLLPNNKNITVRRALAITNLKNFSRLFNQPDPDHITRNHRPLRLDNWDETDAGTLANDMVQVNVRTPLELGSKLLELGLVQPHTTRSLVLDTIYDNSTNTLAQIVEENNKLVFLMGDQLDQLFDPLLEYSPEKMRFEYQVPETYSAPQVQDDELVNTIIQELLSVQTNYTMGLVNLLQNFIIPLRIHVLALSTDTGMAKINLVFPPTIDEVTRINCILHEALTRALKYGYVEVFKVCGMMLPYFYKAFIRHEANLKNFSKRLHRFSSKNEEKILHNKNINKGNYSLQEIYSIVQGSLLELSKLKLILLRLQSSIDTAKEKMAAKKPHMQDEDSIIRKYLESAIEVVDAFGGEIAEPVEPTSGRHRVFTPSGKLLVEMALNWPTELQYNWLTRNVVGIFELQSVSSDLCNVEILIIFSDYLLFLCIDDTAYYGPTEDGIARVSVADILMHSLINEKPLPHLALIPRMRVGTWCGINDVLVSHYETLDENKQHVRFLSLENDGFRKENRKREGCFSKSFEVLGDHSADKITELVMKARVLHKMQPFHLFKSSSTDLSVYLTAQQIHAYEEEQSRSPVAIFLNMQIDDPVKYFKIHPGLELIMQASFLSTNRIQLMAYNRERDFIYNDIVLESEFARCVRDIVATNFKLMMLSHNMITDAMGRAYESDLAYYANEFLGVIQTEETPEPTPMMKSRKSVVSLVGDERRSKKIEAKMKEEGFENVGSRSGSRVDRSRVTSRKVTNDEKVASSPPQKPQSTTKRFMLKIFRFKKKAKDPEPKHISRNISDTDIPRGHRPEFNSLMSPVPELRNQSESEPTRKRSLKTKVSNRTLFSNGSLVSARINHKLHLPTPEIEKTEEVFGNESLRNVTGPEDITQNLWPRRNVTSDSQDSVIVRRNETFGEDKANVLRVSSKQHRLRIQTDLQSERPEKLPQVHVEEPQVQNTQVHLEEPQVKHPQVHLESQPPQLEHSQAHLESYPPQFENPPQLKSQAAQFENLPQLKQNQPQFENLPQLKQNQPQLEQQPRVFQSPGNSQQPYGHSQQTHRAQSQVAGSTTASSRVSSKSKRSSLPPVPPIDLSHIRLREFYSDGQSNWVTITMSRENSSLYDEMVNLRADPDSLADAVKTHSPVVSRYSSGASRGDSATVMDSNSSTTATSTSHLAETSDEMSKLFSKTMNGPLIENFVTRFDSSGRVLSGNHSNFSLLVFEVPHYFALAVKEELVQSLSLTQVIEEFSRNIHFDSEDTQTLSQLNLLDETVFSESLRDDETWDNRSDVSESSQDVSLEKYGFDYQKSLNRSMDKVNQNKDMANQNRSMDKISQKSIDMSNQNRSMDKVNQKSMDKLVNNSSNFPSNISSTNSIKSKQQTIVPDSDNSLLPPVSRSSDEDSDPPHRVVLGGRSSFGTSKRPESSAWFGSRRPYGKRLSTATTTSSEEEFYSPDEFDFNWKAEVEPSVVSSDATITNNGSPKLENEKFVRPIVRSETMMIPRDSLVGYLSDLLNGKIDLEY